MICPRCQIDKDPKDFAKNKARSSGYNYYCRPCNSAQRFARLGRGPIRFGPKNKDYSAPIRVCNRCKVPKPKEEFFTKFSQCKVCCNDLRKIRQENKRKLKLAKRGWRIDLMDLSPLDKVNLAISRGARSQDQIRQLTRLSENYVCKALAQLYDKGKLDRVAIRQRVYRMAA